MNRETQESDPKTNNPLDQRKAVSGHTKHVLGELGDEDLEQQNEEEDRHEHPVAKESFEYVYLIINYSCIYHIENLEKNESGKDNCVMSTCSMHVLVLFIQRIPILVVLMSWIDHAVVVNSCVLHVFRNPSRAIEQDQKHDHRVKH